MIFISKYMQLNNMSISHSSSGFIDYFPFLCIVYSFSFICKNFIRVSAENVSSAKGLGGQVRFRTTAACDSANDTLWQSRNKCKHLQFLFG